MIDCFNLFSFSLKVVLWILETLKKFCTLKSEFLEPVATKWLKLDFLLRFLLGVGLLVTWKCLNW